MYLNHLFLRQREAVFSWLGDEEIHSWIQRYLEYATGISRESRKLKTAIYRLNNDCARVWLVVAFVAGIGSDDRTRRPRKYGALYPACWLVINERTTCYKEDQKTRRLARNRPQRAASRIQFGAVFGLMVDMRHLLVLVVDFPDQKSYGARVSSTSQNPLASDSFVKTQVIPSGQSSSALHMAGAPVET